MASTQMQQQANTLQVNQVNAQVTNVFNDEQQQLITLQVTAAAGAQIAEAQMAAQMQVAAADSIVQQQNARIAQLTQAAENTHQQVFLLDQERLQLQVIATQRVQELERELALAKQSLAPFQWPTQSTVHFHSRHAHSCWRRGWELQFLIFFSITGYTRAEPRYR